MAFYALGSKSPAELFIMESDSVRSLTHAALNILMKLETNKLTIL